MHAHTSICWGGGKGAKLYCTLKYISSSLVTVVATVLATSLSGTFLPQPADLDGMGEGLCLFLLPTDVDWGCGSSSFSPPLLPLAYFLYNKKELRKQKEAAANSSRTITVATSWSQPPVSWGGGSATAPG